ncbi:MAG TPA: hypothetical protein VFU65_00485 [Actinocrinis sp.]|nr:hypothetical protein [Actinocrinis sp.]
MTGERRRGRDDTEGDQDARALDPVAENIREHVGETGGHEQRGKFDQLTAWALQQTAHGNTLLTSCCAAEDPL